MKEGGISLVPEIHLYFFFSSDGASVRQFLSIHAMYAGGRDWWVSGNDLGTENSWKWLAGSDVSLDLFLQGVAAPIGTDYNCMLLSYGINFYGMAQYCEYRFYPVCQYSY